MPTDRHIDAFGRPASHCSNCYARCPRSAFASNHQIDSISSDPWALEAPSHNGSPNQALAKILDATATRDQHAPFWSPNLSPSNRRFQHQAVSTANNGWNNEWNLDAPFQPPAWDPASQGFALSLSHVTPSFGQRFIPALSSADYPPVYFNAITNSQPDPTFQLPDFGVYNDFGIVPDSFADPTSFTQWDDLTAMVIDPQETMASFNQLPLPTTTSMPATPALTSQATSMLTAPAVPRPISRRATSRRSNVNTNAHTCDYAGCGTTFARPGDLARHRQQHGVPQHPCLVRGCNRHGSRGFYRADKLRDHQRRKHGMAI